MVTGTWLAPGPLRASSLERLRTWLEGLTADVALVALDVVEVAAERVDPFVLAAGLSTSPGLPSLGVAVALDAGRLPPLIGRELVALDHVVAGPTGLVVTGSGESLDEAARILSAQLAGLEVAGEPSGAMPAAFDFTPHPGSATPGGPTVLVVDAAVGARTLEGEAVESIKATDAEVLAGSVSDRGSSPLLLVRRGGPTGAIVPPLAL